MADKKTQKVWKEFSRNELSHSAAHYLMAIAQIHEEQGYARLIDVSKKLNISKGSLSTSLKPLIKRGLVVEDENKHLFLSEQGKSFASNIRHTYFTFKHFLIEVLGIDPEIAEIDACKVEHLLSTEATNELIHLVKALEEDNDLAKSLKNAMNKYKKCNVEGCNKCEKNFCLR